MEDRYPQMNNTNEDANFNANDSSKSDDCISLVNPEESIPSDIQKVLKLQTSASGNLSADQIPSIDAANLSESCENEVLADPNINQDSKPELTIKQNCAKENNFVSNIKQDQFLNDSNQDQTVLNVNGTDESLQQVNEQNSVGNLNSPEKLDENHLSVRTLSKNKHRLSISYSDAEHDRIYYYEQDPNQNRSSRLNSFSSHVPKFISLHHRESYFETASSYVGSVASEITCFGRPWEIVKNNLLTLFFILSVAGGIGLGIYLRTVHPPFNTRYKMYLRFPGDILMNMLQLLVLPLIVSSLVSSLAALEKRSSRMLGIRAAVYYLVTTVLAVIIGILLVTTIQPGKHIGEVRSAIAFGHLNAVDAFLDLVRNMFPDNLVTACFRKYVTEQVEIQFNVTLTTPATQPLGSSTLKMEFTTSTDTSENSTTAWLDNGTTAWFDNGTTAWLDNATTGWLDNGTTGWWKQNSTSEWNVIDTTKWSVNTLTPLLQETTTTKPTNDKVQDVMTILSMTQFEPQLKQMVGMNILGLVIFSVVLGFTISSMGHQGYILLEFFTALNIATMKIICLVMWYSPFGILFLLANKIVDMDDNPAEVFTQLGLYTGTVMAGLICHGFLILPLIYFLMTRKNPVCFLYGISQALITALGTSSSSATLPVTLQCLEERNNIHSIVARFVAPIGATINMDGTALYEAVACIFVAQNQGLALTFGEVIVISITATAAAIGAAGIPQAGFFTLLIVLSAVGLPKEEASLILAVDWILDRFRTMVNVIGDAIGAGIIAYLSQDDLPNLPNM